jgi:urea carboxylase
MFRTVLIANRGEIACRILRTLKKLEIRSVAVYSEADRHARHVREADAAVCIGPAPAKQSYLDVERVLRAARDSGAEAIHPGYGFLSENASFAASAEAAGVAFIGPTPEQIRAFGLKHSARELALAAGVPLLPGTELLPDLALALAEAERIGYPVMLKSTAGGGGIGMQLCRNAADLERRYEAVVRLSLNNFGDAGVYLERFVERARHLEVQLFGDGRGNVIALGERDCSAQRRNQKVLEEALAPNLDPELRAALIEAAVRLGESVRYRSAGTVEFVLDAELDRHYFLEVNTRLQVEHGVTELVTGVDLVEWMLRTAAGEAPDLHAFHASVPRGHAIEARVYAEDPVREFRPSSGLLTRVVLPDARVDTWVETGSDVSPFYDPLLAKIISWGDDRSSALAKLSEALDAARFDGIETNLAYLRELARDGAFRAGEVTTAHLATKCPASRSFEVIKAGTFSIVVDQPGRLGYWNVGIPPSGPMDALHHALANRIVGNTQGAAALELTMSGPTLRFACDAVVALSGAQMPARLEGVEVRYFEPIEVRAGQSLELGQVQGAGARTYLALRGGLDVPEYLGSRTTFTLGGFGGHGGRALRPGDVLHIGAESELEPKSLPVELRPALANSWQIGVLYGPHGAPDFFTARDIEQIFSAKWQVHYNSNRTGVRLLGPKPEWARSDGGEAGLHPSNIHDVAYAVGAIDFTGDMPILLGPDGPSLGGFVCPGVIAAAELWKMGQLRPGDTVQLVPTSDEGARSLEREQRELKEGLHCGHRVALCRTEPEGAILLDHAPAGERPRVVYRRAGDRYVLVEYGPIELDLRLRFRVQSLMSWLEGTKPSGVIDITPGIRSLQIHFDPGLLESRRLLGLLEAAEREIDAEPESAVASRVVHLPLSWDDPATRLAIDKYMQSVRPDAPWCPSNIEFIRRINGLDTEAAVRDIVFDASYLVLGLGDVYLGAPVATPIDPRHRLVTTKYNPARTWTPENAVGIGGAYLCIYGMEGPGGYQFVGRTLQMFNRFRTSAQFEPGKPWLLRFFDRIRFYPVGAAELLEMREAFLYGKFELEVEEGTFSLPSYSHFLAEHRESISNFKARQQQAFDAERQRWKSAGKLEFDEPREASRHSDSELVPGTESIDSHVPGSVWKVAARVGARLQRGETVLVVESMKMEINVEAPADGTLIELLVSEGQAVAPGQRVAVFRPEGGA